MSSRRRDSRGRFVRREFGDDISGAIIPLDPADVPVGSDDPSSPLNSRLDDLSGDQGEESNTHRTLPTGETADLAHTSEFIDDDNESHSGSGEATPANEELDEEMKRIKAFTEGVIGAQMKALMKENDRIMESAMKTLSDGISNALPQFINDHTTLSKDITSSKSKSDMKKVDTENVIENDVSINDHEKISKAWKTVKTYKSINPFIGDGDPRSVLEFKNEIESTQSYLFSTSVEKYCYVYIMLAPRVSRQMDYLLKKYRSQISTFGQLLDKLWQLLEQEYGNVGDAFNSRMKLMRLCMSPCSDVQDLMNSFESYTEQFITLADELKFDTASQSEDASRLTNRETNAYYLHGLLPQITNKLERDMSPQVLETIAFTELRHRARACVRYMVKKAKQNPKMDLEGTVNFNQSTAPIRYTKAYLAQFRCQRCCSNSHPTFLCRAAAPIGAEVRCKVCGIEHDNDTYVARCQARDPSTVKCQRGQAEGHMGRICCSTVINPMSREQRLALFQSTNQTTPLTSGGSPKDPTEKSAASSSQPTAASCVLMKKDDLPYIKVSIQFKARGKPVLINQAAMIDSGANAAFVSQTIAKRWENLGCKLTLYSENRSITPVKIILANGSHFEPLGFIDGLNIYVDGVSPIPIKLCYIVPRVSGEGFILPYSLFTANHVMWLSTPSGSSVMVFGEEAKAMYIKLTNKECKWIPVCYKADGPPRLASFAIEETEEKVEEMPLRFIADEKAPRGRPTVAIPWKSESRPPLNFLTVYARDKRCQSVICTGATQHLEI